MINTLLNGQYVVIGWSQEVQYHLIVAVTIDRGELTLWARNLDGRINQYVADGCFTVRKPPPVVERDKQKERWEEEDNSTYKYRAKEKLDELQRKVDGCVAP